MSKSQTPATPSGPTGRKQFAVNAAASWLANGVKAGLQLLLLPVMARLLGPNEFGIYALAQPTVTFFVTLAESGIGTSLAREDESNEAVWSTAFWVLMITFASMAGCVAASGFALSTITGQSQLIGLMAALSLALPLMALSVTPDARILRRGNLTLHSWTDIASALTSSAIAVTLALYGWGVWSLAGQYLSNYFVRACVLNIIAFKRPRAIFDLSSLKNHLGMGGALVSRRLGEMVARSLENALFERVFGPGMLGSYAISMQISRFACDVVTNPPSGALYAYTLGNSNEAARSLQNALLTIIGLLLLPCMSIAAVVAPHLLPLALGPKWETAGWLLQPVIVAYAVVSIAGLNDAVLMRHNLTYKATVPALFAAAGRVGAVALGPWVGAQGVAWVVAVVFIIQAISLAASMPRSLTDGLAGLVKALQGPALCSLAASAVCLATSHAIGGLSGDLMAIAAAIAVYILTTWTFSGRRLQPYLVTARSHLRRSSAPESGIAQ